MPMHQHPRGWLMRPLLVAGVFFCALVPAAAEVRVTDVGPNAIRVEVRAATVGQILEALRVSHRVEFRAGPGLSHLVTGTYTGPLRRVLARILDGSNYVIHSTRAGFEVEIVGTGPVRTANGPAPPMVVNRTGQNVDPDLDVPAVRPVQAASSHGPAPQPRMVNGFLDLDGEIRSP